MRGDGSQAGSGDLSHSDGPERLSSQHWLELKDHVLQETSADRPSFGKTGSGLWVNVLTDQILQALQQANSPAADGEQQRRDAAVGRAIEVLLIPRKVIPWFSLRGLTLCWLEARYQRPDRSGLGCCANCLHIHPSCSPDWRSSSHRSRCPDGALSQKTDGSQKAWRMLSKPTKLHPGICFRPKRTHFGGRRLSANRQHGIDLNQFIEHLLVEAQGKLVRIRRYLQTVRRHKLATAIQLRLYETREKTGLP